jgi:hypothetical protein
LLAGCATTDDRWTVDYVPVGSRVIVEQPLPVSSYSGRVHIQDGQSVPPRLVNRFAPRCSISLRRESRDEERVTRIEPGEFEVTGHSTQRRVSALEDEKPVMLASRKREGASISYIHYVTRLDLRSPEQRQVHHMSCVREVTRRDRYLGFVEIRDTLAGVARLELPAGD